MLCFYIKCIILAETKLYYYGIKKTKTSMMKKLELQDGLLELSKIDKDGKMRLGFSTDSIYLKVHELEKVRDWINRQTALRIMSRPLFSTKTIEWEGAELTAVYEYTPYERQTFYYPGCQEDAEIHYVFNGYQDVTDMFDEDQLCEMGELVLEILKTL